MALIDILLLAAIISVLAILGAGGFVLMFRKRFSFLKRPYPETGMRLSKRLPVRSSGDQPMVNGKGKAPVKGQQEDSAWNRAANDQPPITKMAGSEALPGARAPGAHMEGAGYRAGRPLGAAPGAAPGGTPDTLTAGAPPPHALEEIAEEFPAAFHEGSTVHEQKQTAVWEKTAQATPGIPWSYGDCKIAALARDPYWLFVYWEINEAKREEIARRFGYRAWDESRPVLRVYDTTNLYFFDSRQYVEIGINDYANNWYIRTGQPNRTFCIELGRVRPDGAYIFLARSNFVSTPRDQVSEVIDEEWLLPPEYATRLYQRIGGIYPGPSSPGLMGPGEYISSPGLPGPGVHVGSPMKW